MFAVFKASAGYRAYLYERDNIKVGIGDLISDYHLHLMLSDQPLSSARYYRQRRANPIQQQILVTPTYPQHSKGTALVWKALKGVLPLPQQRSIFIVSVFLTSACDVWMLSRSVGLGVHSDRLLPGSVSRVFR